MSFIAELKRRNVFKVGIAYLVGAWLLIQVADILLDSIGAPTWVLQTIFVVLLVGFFIAVIFAWAFELTPDGVKREKEVDRSQSITPQTGKKLNNAILVLMALAIGYLLYDKFSGPAQPGSESISQQTSELDTNAGDKLTLTPAEATDAAGAEAPVSKQSIAVLPFANRSRNEDDEFFVEGVHDDLLTNLARIGALKVISRTSVLRYKDTEMPIPAIAAELGVATVMEGAVQRSGNQVRINVQLIDAKTDEHLWAEIYDRELTAENLFAIQSEISQAIADALQATLTPDEKDRINTAPTENLQAHDAFLRGRQLIAERKSDSLEGAVAEFRKAVALDPQFALAWVGLADSTILLSTYGTLSRDAAIPIMEDAIDRALAINGQLGEAYASQAEIYVYYKQYEQAEIAYRKAIELSPNYAQAWMWYSSFLSDYPLRIQEAVDAARKAAELDPASAINGLSLGSKYSYQGLLSLAEKQYQKVIALNPGFAPAYVSLGDYYQFLMGQPAKALPLYQRAIELDPGNVGQQESIADLYLAIGDIPNVLKVREHMAEIDPNNYSVGMVDVKLNLRQDNPAGTREAIKWLVPKASNNAFRTQWLGFISLATGDTQWARDIYLAGQPGWLEPDQWPGLIKHFATHGCVVSWIFMNTGDEQLGSALLAQTTAFLDQSVPSVMEHTDTWHPELCYLAAGDTDKALAMIETQLSHNHGDPWWLIKEMPIYEPVRFEPRFQAAMQEYDKRMALQREAIEAEGSL